MDYVTCDCLTDFPSVLDIYTTRPTEPTVRNKCTIPHQSRHLEMGLFTLNITTPSDKCSKRFQRGLKSYLMTGI